MDSSSGRSSDTRVERRRRAEQNTRIACRSCCGRVPCCKVKPESACPPARPPAALPACLPLCPLLSCPCPPPLPCPTCLPTCPPAHLLAHLSTVLDHTPSCAPVFLPARLGLRLEPLGPLDSTSTRGKTRESIVNLFRCLCNGHQLQCAWTWGLGWAARGWGRCVGHREGTETASTGPGESGGPPRVMSGGPSRVSQRVHVSNQAWGSSRISRRFAPLSPSASCHGVSFRISCLSFGSEGRRRDGKEPRFESAVSQVPGSLLARGIRLGPAGPRASPVVVRLAPLFFLPSRTFKVRFANLPFS